MPDYKIAISSISSEGKPVVLGTGTLSLTQSSGSAYTYDLEITTGSISPISSKGNATVCQFQDCQGELVTTSLAGGAEMFVKIVPGSLGNLITGFGVFLKGQQVIYGAVTNSLITNEA